MPLVLSQPGVLESAAAFNHWSRQARVDWVDLPGFRFFSKFLPRFLLALGTPGCKKPSMHRGRNRAGNRAGTQQGWQDGRMAGLDDWIGCLVSVLSYRIPRNSVQSRCPRPLLKLRESCSRDKVRVKTVKSSLPAQESKSILRMYPWSERVHRNSILLS